MQSRFRGDRSSALMLWLLLVGAACIGFSPASLATVITAFPANFSVGEQTSFNGAVAVFEDDNPAATSSDFTATIDWGDGSPTTIGSIGSSSAAFVVLSQHTYADEGAFTVTVTISDVSPGTGTATTTDTATVTEGDALSGSPVTFHAQAGVAVTTTVATFTDALSAAVPGDFTATIDWGDGTVSAGTIAGGAGSFQVSGTHTYAATGNFSVTVTLSDDAPGTATAATVSTAVVSNTPLGVTVTNFSTPEHAAFNGNVGTFFDVDTTKTAASFSANVDWGDGTTTPGTVSGASGSFAVSGTHTYADEGSYTITLSAAENAPGTATGTATGTASVTEADVLSATPITFVAVAGSPFSGIVANVSDTDTSSTAANFAATIAWGDGTTTPGTITGAGGSFQVSGTHTYAASGAFAVTVTVTDNAPGTATAAAASTANVSAAGSGQLAATPALGARETVLLALLVALIGFMRARRPISVRSRRH